MCKGVVCFLYTLTFNFNLGINTMKKNIVLSCFMLSVGLGGLGQSAIADTFHADVLNSGITAARTYSAGNETTTFDMTLVTTGTASHIKLSYDCEVLGVNNHTLNKVTFKNAQDGNILSINGCVIGGVSDGESSQLFGTRVIPIPFGTTSLELYAQQQGSLSYSGNISQVVVDILGKSYTFIDFNTPNFYDFSSTGNSSQNVSDNYTVEDSGATLHLAENTWKAIDNVYTVTMDTVLEFDFYSTAEGDIHGIGFSADLIISDGEMFKLYGSQSYSDAVTLYQTYAGNEGTWVHYTINVGAHYTGSFNYLFFLNDDDSTIPTANGYFRNIEIYEQ